jgi:Cys-tRNA(Pro) deacylase
MAKAKHPSTPAVRELKDHKVSFSLHTYPYEEGGGTSWAAKMLDEDEHRIIKTLVMETESGDPLLVLMHGDRSVSTKALARVLGTKRIRPCDSRTALRHTGYQVGGISPFGTRKRLKVIMERGIMDLPEIFINAGKRGLLAQIASEELVRVLTPQTVSVAL